MFSGVGEGRRCWDDYQVRLFDNQVHLSWILLALSPGVQENNSDCPMFMRSGKKPVKRDASPWKKIEFSEAEMQQLELHNPDYLHRLRDLQALADQAPGTPAVDDETRREKLVEVLGLYERAVTCCAFESYFSRGCQQYDRRKDEDCLCLQHARKV